MRYRLRTLLILMAILGLALSRISYLKQKRDFHLQEVARLKKEIAIAENEIDSKVVDSIQDFATGDTILFFHRTDLGGLPVPLLDNKNRAIWAKDVPTADLWSAAVSHQVIANRYDRAIYRPWSMVSEQRAPQ